METFVDKNGVEWIVRITSSDPARPRVVADVSPTSLRFYTSMVGNDGQPLPTASLTGQTVDEVQKKIADKVRGIATSEIGLRVTATPDMGSWLLFALIALAVWAYDTK